MSYNIAVITQEEIEPEVGRHLTLTMPPPGLAPASIPKLAEKKLQQKGIFGKEAIEGVKVQAHMHGSKLVNAYERKLTSNNNKGKTVNPKKKAAKQPKHAAYPKVQDDWKKSVELARELDRQYKIDYFEALRK
jgi:uncharacterized protein YxeA